MSTPRGVRHTYAEYLSALEVSELKLEFLDGEIYAMAGGSLAHAELGARVVRLLGNALDGLCRSTSPQNVKVYT